MNANVLSRRPFSRRWLFTTALAATAALLADSQIGLSQDAPSKASSAEGKKVIAIVGGDIHTVSREVIRSGTILIEDGKISAVGARVKVPEGATVIDASGKQISPGFIAVEMAGVGINGPGSNDKLTDVLNPFDRNVTLSLAVGITTGCVQIGGSSGRGRFRDPSETFLGLEPEPDALLATVDQKELDYGVIESLCPCCGLPILPADPITDPTPQDIQTTKSAVIKMSYGSIDGMLVKEGAFYDVNRGALSGSLNHHVWREQISKARQYLKDQAAHEQATREGKKENPPRKTVSDDLLRLVRGELRLRIPANSQSEIRAALALADELDYKVVLRDVVEGWSVSDLLAEQDAMVTFTPRNRRNARSGEEDRTGSWIEQSRVFQEAGVPFSITALSSSISLNGLAGRDLTSLPLEAAFAVRGGCSEAEALKAITLTAAKMLGIEDRVGSIDVGKDADILILDGAPLDYRAYVETAIVNGQVVYEREKDRALPVFKRR